MKTVIIALEDELYESASREAARRRKTLGDFLRDLFLPGLQRGNNEAEDGATTLKSLWALADARAMTSGSAGPLNRDELYERGLSGH